MGHPESFVWFEENRQRQRLVQGRLELLYGFDGYFALGVGGVVVVAAPCVLFGSGDESSGDWIAVDVLEFFDVFWGG
jgi:hypothetical protein